MLEGSFTRQSFSLPINVVRKHSGGSACSISPESDVSCPLFGTDAAQPHIAFPFHRQHGLSTCVEVA
jgi:hypothetical protein